MPFVTTADMMKKAQAGGYAVGAFNAENLEMVQAIIAAAEAENAPVMIQTTPGTLKYAGPKCFAGLVSRILHRMPLNLGQSHRDADADPGLAERQLPYGLLLVSGNDCAATLARHVAGSTEAFAALMNEKASSLGMADSHFSNPHGVQDESHYTTARDMAALTRTVLQDDDFARMFGASSYTIPASNKYGERLIAQDCELLRSGNLAYGPATACKVGSTEYGGYAITVAAEKDGSGLIAVVLGAPDMASVYADAVRLLDYGFASFRTIMVSEEEIGTKTIEVKNGRRHVADVTFTAESGFRILLPAGIDPELITTDIRISNEDSSDPEKIEAEVLFLLDGAEVGSAKMKKTIERTDFQPQAGTASRLRLYFDYFCVLVLAMFLLRRVMRVVHRLLAPPQ